MYAMKQNDHPKILTELVKSLVRSYRVFYSTKMAVKIGYKSDSHIFRLNMDDCMF